MGEWDGWLKRLAEGAGPAGERESSSDLAWEGRAMVWANGVLFAQTELPEQTERFGRRS